MTQLEHLDREECLALLAAHRVGRLAVNVDGQAPLIRPVNYLFDAPSQSVIFRSAAGSKHHGLLASRKAAFEIDGINMADRTGWSVVVRGRAEQIIDPRELRRLERAPLDPWVPGEKPYWIRIRAWTVTGRRIVEPEAFAQSLAAP